MLRKLLRTAQDYEMPVTKFSPATVRFRLERQAFLSLWKGSFLTGSDIQRDSHRDRRLCGFGPNAVLHEVFQGSLWRQLLLGLKERADVEVHALCFQVGSR